MKTKIAMILLLAAGTAMARQQMNSKNQEPPSAADFVKMLDKDSDGKISKTEFDGPAEHFTTLDKNSDGYISESEAPTGPPPRGENDDQRGQRPERGAQADQEQTQQRPANDLSESDGSDFVTRLDKDNDGKVSKTEFDGPSEHFSQLDKNSDGYLSSDEAPSGRPPKARSGERPSRR